VNDYPIMSDFSGSFSDVSRRKKAVARYRWVALAGISAGAILFQIYVPRFFAYLSYLELPLLVTVYFAIMRRSAIAAMFFGAAIGLAQDSLSAQPLGMFGIAKTLVGYLGVMASLRVDIERGSVRAGLAFAFFAVHQVLYWMMVRSLLGQPLEFNWPRELVQAVLNAAVAAPLYHLLDKLKISD
jgi:rod shape-determining protein MreD